MNDLELTLLGKEHYDLMAAFERDYKGCGRMDRESKEYWAQGAIYQQGDINQLFKAYRRGYALHKGIAS